MKRILLLLFLSFGFMQLEAQISCSFTYTQNNNNVTFSHNWALPMIYSLDSLVFNYGDGSSATIAPPTATSSHTYPNVPGVYIVCMTRYMHQLGSPNTIIPCTYCDSLVIGGTQSCAVNVSASATGNTVTANATASGGTAPYMYQYTLNPGNITNSTGVFPGLANGNYAVCVTAFDATQTLCSIGCDSVTVLPNFFCTTNIQTAVGTNSITATATTTGGMPPYVYTYTLNPGNVTNSTGIFTGLTNGTYVVCATSVDANNVTCMQSCNTIVLGPPMPCSTNLNAITNGNTIISTATAVGGTPPFTYTYTLNPGNITNSTGVFSGLANGSYTVCATAIDGMNNLCSTDCDTVVVGNTLGCITSVNTTASGTTITANATANFGTAPYTYQYTLNPGNITNSTGIFNGLANGTYIICATATDAQNIVCATACDSATIGGTTNCQTNVTAFAAGNTITASATATMGTPPFSYQYTLNPGNITNSTGIFAGMANGIYIVCATATDAQNVMCTPGCDSIIVGNVFPSNCIINAAFLETITGLNVTFSNSSTVSNGIILGTNWFFGDGNTSTLSSPSHTYIAAGTYNVILIVNGIDSLQNPCVDSSTKMVTVGPSSISSDGLGNLRIYPNPAKKSFIIEDEDNQSKEIFLFNPYGQVILKVQSTQKKTIINTNNLAYGLYYLKINKENFTYTQTILIE